MFYCKTFFNIKLRFKENEKYCINYDSRKAIANVVLKTNKQGMNKNWNHNEADH